MHHATKIVITTEHSILDQIAEIIEAHGVTGYTYMTAGGKGSRGKRRMNRGPASASILSNVKIEAIVANRAVAEAIIEEIATAFFDDYSGIAYVEAVEILRPGKFRLSTSDLEDDLG